MSGAAEDARLAVYFHWPFCLSKCPYCDFNSHVGPEVDQARWRNALLDELDHYAERVPERVITSVYFGGGTPSLMEPATAAALIERVARHWRVADDLEVTLEANPTSSEARSFAAFRAAGVNRLSLGVLALDDGALEFLERGHDQAQAIEALEIARRCFPRTSFDMIYARPGQTLAAWRRELGEALSLGPEHLSLYQLTIERGTPFYAALRHGALRLPDDETGRRLYDLTQDRLETAGLAAYEISNHAIPGAECRHNLAYWRCHDYLGVGPGAHGRLTVDGTRRATRQAHRPEAWLKAVEAHRHATVEEGSIGPDAELTEMTVMGLRLTEGLDRERFERRTGRTLEAAFAAERLGPLIDEGYLDLDARGLRATPSGRRVLNAVLAELLG